MAISPVQLSKMLVHLVALPHTPPLVLGLLQADEASTESLSTARANVCMT